MKELIGKVVIAVGTCGQAKGLLISGVLKSVNELHSVAIVYNPSMGNAEVDLKTVEPIAFKEDSFYVIKIRGAHENETTNYYVNHNFRGIELAVFYNGEGKLNSSQYIQDVYNIRNIEGFKSTDTTISEITKQDFQLILDLFKD